MDLKDINNKEALLSSIDELMNGYTSMLRSYADNPATYKTAALLYYWLRDYKRLLLNEAKNKPELLPDLNRGSIVSVNLGYNIGSEQGGLHYGIVLHDVPRKSDVATIIPLTSIKNERKLRPFEIYLGNEIYNQMLGKYKALKVSIPSEIATITSVMNSLPAECFSQSQLATIESKIDELNKQYTIMTNVLNKINRLKHGSLALVNQITTISRARISDPCSKHDILYGIKATKDTMDNITEKVMKFYGMTLTTK